MLRRSRERLLSAACGGVAHAYGIDTLEKSSRVRPDAEILAKLLRFAAGRFGHQIEDSLLARSPRTRVRFWIVHRQRPFEMVAVRAPKGLLQAHLIAMDVAVGVEPGALVKPVRLHDERVALPVTHGKS